MGRARGSIYSCGEIMPEKHPRIVLMEQFYRNGPKVCSFMNPDVTRFVLVRKSTDEQIGRAAVAWAQTREPLALSYVWARDPKPRHESDAAVYLFGRLAKALYEAETGTRIDPHELAREIDYLFSPQSDRHPHLSYGTEAFYAIAMGPRHTARYAPCFSVVLTREADVNAAHPALRARIRAESTRRMGREYDANALFIEP